MTRFKDTLNSSVNGDSTFSHKSYVEDLDNNDNMENQDTEFIEQNLFKEINEILHKAESRGMKLDFFEFVLQYRIKQFELREDIVRADIVRSYLYPEIEEELQ